MLVRTPIFPAPVLGLIFLRFAEARFAARRKQLEAAEATSRRGSQVDEPNAYHAENLQLTLGVQRVVSRTDRRVIQERWSLTTRSTMCLAA